MAGIGFELRKMLRRNTLLGLMQAYTYAGLIGAGPWVLSIVGILLIGVLSIPFVLPTGLITQFQVSVTYLISLSLVLTGPLQLAYTRFTSDRLFEKRRDLVLPNFHAVMFIVTVASTVLGGLAVVFLFPQQTAAYRLLMLAGFVVMGNIWIATIFLSGMKQYMSIIVVFFIGYAVTTGAALSLNRFGLTGLLSGFVVGQTVLLMGLLALIYRDYRSDHFISFEMFRKQYRYPSLMLTGLLYNLGIWADKFMFWYSPGTGQAVIGPLRASIIYDIPVFLAYLAIIPGMAVFLMRIETDFVEYYDAFYDAVREGASLQHIERMRNAMVEALRNGIWEIMKVQAIAAMMLFAAGTILLQWLQISTLYLPLLYIDVIAASMQVVFMGTINVFFYLDKRKIVLLLVGTFVASNVVLTAITLSLNPAFYGYGFAGSLLLVVLASLYLLDRKLDSLEYETFMLQ
ncbi:MULTISPECIES: exopolysaccharide Pel transporter PelG [Paraburkholderia]|uniref:Pellicle/biofilm biosynthesis Wzx-like polysaccharide transporter PelG n=1 Tax=Paraburkholderia largidicola TaxID=3014751 RepID=A0A7I8BRN3_9BURK|nr:MULTISPECIES: exopolysaccharide Pel transporter PelG [Paraburkholderia]BEU24620.1 exopolysaccharide Pel transporter PelG [Paraburkholderia sp. 22B1P]GJH32789.1 exopolysaccharide Pel transporter PelG [Paraburkholderia hospita]CAG9270906.1 Histidine kinase [Paraburkholderia caribensis]BCF90831.1 pellicle/biofilm biosynthesis Wzx-like polysaccharide transporter PelG [Paraburkholderia sp. PGU16]GJH01535.1 exopolysaccharide Pel transporter PelG [Paraburkholderia terrae]